VSPTFEYSIHYILPNLKTKFNEMVETIKVCHLPLKTKLMHFSSYAHITLYTCIILFDIAHRS